MFDALRDWWINRKAIGELAAWQEVDDGRDSVRFIEILERAEAAMAADQRNSAQKLWLEIRERYYAQAIESPRVFKILMDLYLFDEAERLMDQGLARHPRKQLYIVGKAQVAERRGDIPSALERWAIVRKKFPYLALGYAHSAACLTKAGEIDEAEKMLTRGIARSPKDVFCLIEHARIAETRGAFDEALLRWQHLRDVQDEPTHPLYQNGTLGLAQCLHKMQRLDEAETLLLQFNGRFKTQEATLLALARIAEDRGDTDEALRRWRQVTTKFPMLTEGYLSLVQFLKKTSQADQVEAVLCDAMERFPTEAWPAVDYAMVAQERGDLEEIARRWIVVTDRFPSHENAYRHGAEALTQLGRDEEASALRVKYAQHFTARGNA